MNKNNLKNAKKNVENVGGDLQKKAADDLNVKKHSVEKKVSFSLLISYAIYFVIASAICLLIISGNNIFNLTSKRKIFAILNDGFFVSGVVIAGFGVIYKIASGGILDSVSFSLKRAFLSLIPGGRLRKEENYAEYKERKEKSRKKHKSWAPLIMGLLFIGIATIFLILYEMTPVS